MITQSPRSPLLGRPTPPARGVASHVWSVDLSLDSFPYLADHCVQGLAVLPGSAYVEMALAAATAVDGRRPSTLEALTFERAVFVPAEGTRSLRIVLSSGAAGARDFAVLDLAGDSGRPHATARIPRVGERSDPIELPPDVQLADIRRRSGTDLSGAALYAQLHAAGNEYGPAFQAIQRLWRASGESVGQLRVPATLVPELDRYLLHPAILDAALQVLAAATEVRDRTFVLVGCERLRLQALPGTRCWVHARLRPATQEDPDGLVGDVRLLDDTERPAVELIGVQVRCLPRPKQVSASPERRAPTVAVAANFTAESLRDVLAFWFDTLGLPTTAIRFAPYNQLFQQLLNPTSLLSTNRDGANVLLVRPEDWLRGSGTGASPMDPLDRQALPPGQPRATLPALGEVVHLNAYETEFLYDEIFGREMYLRHGLTLRDGDCVFDVGANIGLFTLFVHQRSRNARVFAFEPAPPAFEALRMNTAFHCPDTKVFNFGLSDANTAAPFTFYRNSSAFSGYHAEPDRDQSVVRTVVENVLRTSVALRSANLTPFVDELMRGRLDAEVYMCETRTLSSVIRDHAVERIDLVKIDVEGGELGVLGGIDDDHWRIIRQIVVEVHDWSGDATDQVTATLRAHGFNVAVEQDERLLGTDLATIFARRQVEGGGTVEAARTAAPAEEDLGRTAQEHLARTAQELIDAVGDLQRRTTVPCIVCLCPCSPGLEGGQRRRALEQVERNLADGLADLEGVLVVTTAELQRIYPVRDSSNPRTNELGHVPYTSHFFAALGTLITRRYLAARQSPWKVMALDCDETLWRGLCGEDGPFGVQVDAPQRALQTFVVAQHEAGMLVCLCSRNNAEDVLAVFRQRRDMPLSLAHVSAWRLNWAAKSANLASLSEELELGLDSFVFLDDDPVQCAEVQAHCPEVLTLQLPALAEEIPGFLEHVWAFDRVGLTTEDRARTGLYRQERERRAVREASLTFESFLASLGLRVRIGPCSLRDVARVAQLTQRTNQFNVTTVRRSEGELRALLASNTLECLVVHAADRFGDYGLVGAMLFRLGADALAVDTFLVSCRALGRGVEHQMLARLGEIAVTRGLARVDVPFAPSARNEPARQFLEGLPRSLAAVGGERAEAGRVFAVQARAASSLTLEHTRPGSDGTAASRTADRVGMLRTEPGPHSPPRVAPAVYRRIAGELRDVDAIVHAIELHRARCRPTLPTAFVPAADDLERRLAALWQRVLGIDEVGIDDNFFDLGGTSLLAIQIMAELRDAFGVEISTLSLFDKSTIRAVAGLLKAGSGDPEWGTRSSARQSRGELRRATHRAAGRQRSSLESRLL